MASLWGISCPSCNLTPPAHSHSHTSTSPISHHSVLLNCSNFCLFLLKVTNALMCFHLLVSYALMMLESLFPEEVLQKMHRIESRTGVSIFLYQWCCACQIGGAVPARLVACSNVPFTTCSTQCTQSCTQLSPQCKSCCHRVSWLFQLFHVNRHELQTHATCISKTPSFASTRITTAKLQSSQAS